MIRDGVDGDLFVGAGDRGALGIERVPAGRDDPRRERGEDDQREEDRVCGRQGEPGLARRFARLVLADVGARRSRRQSTWSVLRAPRSWSPADRGTARRHLDRSRAQASECHDARRPRSPPPPSGPTVRVASLRPPPTAGRAAAGTSCSARRRGPCRARSPRSRPPRRRPGASWRSCRCCARRRRRRPARARRRCCRRPTARAPAGTASPPVSTTWSFFTPRASATAPMKSGPRP